VHFQQDSDFQLEMANGRGPPALAAIVLLLLLLLLLLIVLLLLLTGRSGESKSMSKIKSKKEGTFG
jgi:hypothetical protein